MTTSTPLTLECDGDLGHLILDGPPKNELDFGFFDALGELVEGELPALEIRGLIVSGRGRHFSSGSNVAELLTKVQGADNESSPSWCEFHARHVRRLGQLPYPVVAAVRGCCLGSGLELALACTHRVAADNALIALPEAQHGLIPGCGGTVRLTELVGYRQAMRLIVSGEPISAEQALGLGLIDQVVGRRELMDAAMRLIYCMDERRGLDDR